jgi:predicted transcriptional regulator
MKKSIYSLVLMDEVVEAVDRMAYSMHTSRSNLINQILAEHLSCVTPEMRMQSVFSGMEERTLRQFRVLEQTSARMLALQSQLDYKYKPTVQYSVELYRTVQNGKAGKIRVQLRTQSQSLLAVLEQFFRFWVQLEKCYAPQTAGTVYRLLPARLERSICNPGVTDEAFGALIGKYIRRFDRYLKAYFAGIAFPDKTVAELEAAFRRETGAEDYWI